MIYSLRIRIFLMMLAVAGVAIGTIAVFATITTQQQFTRYINFNQSIQEDQVERAIVTFWTDGLNTYSTDASGNVVYTEKLPEMTTMPFESVEVVTEAVDWTKSVDAELPQPAVKFLSKDFTQNVDFLIDSQRDDVTLLFVRQPEGNVEIFDGSDRPVGSFMMETHAELLPAQDSFFSSVNQGIVIGGILAGLSALMLTVILSRGILRPISALTSAAQRMEHGDLTQRVDLKTKGEIGELAKAFNAMAEALNHNETLRRHMVSDIAHELRTPLTNIRGYLEALQDEVIQPNSETINIIYEEAMLLSHLTQDLQELALAEARKLRIDPYPISVCELVQQAVFLHQPQAEHRQITLLSECPETVPDVYADPKRVGQILHNLLDNALHHTVENGSVIVKVNRVQDAVEVCIEDTGTGIDAEHLPYVFERFYRADPSRSRKTGGAGIGLAIVKELVEAQDGQITMTSKKGIGTVFSFTLPLAGR